MKYDKQLWKKYQDYIKENKFKVWNFFFFIRCIKVNRVFENFSRDERILKE